MCFIYIIQPSNYLHPMYANRMKAGTAVNGDGGDTISAIVASDYRAAQVFHKYGMEFCCGGNVALATACEMRGIELKTIQGELQQACCWRYLPGVVQFESWDIDFLTAYIINVHHEPLRQSLIAATGFLERFVAGHHKKYPYLPELLETFKTLAREVILQFTYEEEIIFPYIKQIAHAHKDRESYAGLLVRTLRKPVENLLQKEHTMVKQTLEHMRTLSHNYHIPPNACPNHRVTFLTLEEIDRDLIQQFHLEANILFPKALKIETELLALR
jgi:regulator of cell morphogenesis and NO signaling